MSIAKNLRKLRKERQLTQKQLAQMTGLNEVTIRSYELGKYEPKTKQLINIAHALDVPLSSLHDGLPWDLEGIDAYLEVGGRTESDMENEKTAGGESKASPAKKKGLLEAVSKESQKNQAWKEDVLLEYYHKLNRKGKEKALEAVEDLTCIEKYTSGPTSHRND